MNYFFNSSCFRYWRWK